MWYYKYLCPLKGWKCYRIVQVKDSAIQVKHDAHAEIMKNTTGGKNNKRVLALFWHLHYLLIYFIHWLIVCSIDWLIDWLFVCLFACLLPAGLRVAKFHVYRGRNVGIQPPKLSKYRILAINLFIYLFWLFVRLIDWLIVCSFVYLFIYWCFSLLFSFKGSCKNSYQSSTTEKNKHTEKQTVNQGKKEEEKEKHKNHKLLPGCPILSLFFIAAFNVLFSEQIWWWWWWWWWWWRWWWWWWW